MRTPVPDYLQELLDDVKTNEQGNVADYIPALAAASPDQCAIALTTTQGRTHSAGDTQVEFSIQSISKPFAYAAALETLGLQAVDATVGVEPSGEAFNELSLEGETHRPKNAMINAGAIATHSLLGRSGGGQQSRVDQVVEFFSRMAGRELEIDREVFSSEMETAHRNLAIAHMLRTYEIIQDDPHEVVAGYTAQCSVALNVGDLSMMAATLANNGRQPVSGDQVISPHVARRVLSVMAAAGMYDAAGSWITDVGIPAKSGVAGGLIGALPGQVGAAVFSPRLDAHGNSVRGVQAFGRLSVDMGMHLFEPEVTSDSVVLSWQPTQSPATIELGGDLRFVGAEAALDALAQDPPQTDTIRFDLTRVHHVADVGRRMLLEGMRRLRLEGHAIELRDPENRLPEPDMGDGVLPTPVG